MTPDERELLVRTAALVLLASNPGLDVDKRSLLFGIARVDPMREESWGAFGDLILKVAGA